MTSKDFTIFSPAHDENLPSSRYQTRRSRVGGLATNLLSGVSDASESILIQAFKHPQQAVSLNRELQLSA